MEPILQLLDAEWPRIATSPQARRALIRWANDHEALAGMRDLHDVLRCRRDPQVANEVHQALARSAATDQLAARTLLQILLPGLVRLVGTVGHDDPDAPDELVAMAWERICTYPTSRNGSVAANVDGDTCSWRVALTMSYLRMLLPRWMMTFPAAETFGGPSATWKKSAGPD